MRIVFVEPKSPDLHVYSRMPLPRLGTILLATILRERGHDATVQIEELGKIRLEDIEKADAVGISVITSTAPRGYHFARLFREMGKTVFMGGPHATYLPDEALEECDYVLRGEADETIVPFVEALEKGMGFAAVPGLSWRRLGAAVHNPGGGYCTELDRQPAPDFRLITNHERRMDITPIMTSRGCPYDCGFCSVTDMFGRKFRHKSTERVLEELRQHRALCGENGIKNGDDWVFFYDDNFTINKNRAKELLRAMIREKLTPYWTAQASVNVADDDELLDLMRQANCYLLYIGFESINPETLKAYNKKQTAERIEKAIRKLHRHGIRVHGMFVFGADTDNSAVIDRTVAFAKRNRLHSVQFMVLTPLPGTRVYREMNHQQRITCRDWRLYDAHHVVFTPARFSQHGLQLETITAMLRFYGLAHTLRRTFFLLLRLHDLKRSLIEISIKFYARRTLKDWLRRKKEWIAGLSHHVHGVPK